MDQETREFLDKKFTAIDAQFEETKRYFDVVSEGLEHKIQLVGEGVSNLSERFDRELIAFREENEQAHKEILAAIKFSYAELDQRMCTLERGFQTLTTRMDRLEATRN